jgi:hypothetical protein
MIRAAIRATPSSIPLETRSSSLAAVAALMSTLVFSCSHRESTQVATILVDDPKVTEVVATLETPIPNGKNAIWCASFLAAWKGFVEQVTQEAIALKESDELVASLNSAPDPRPDIPPMALYVASGWRPEGIIQRIQKDMAHKFPSKPTPTFADAAIDSFVAYSYLEANVKFSLPYFQNRQPLEFSNSDGRKISVTSFGIRHEDDYAFFKLRSQPRILFRKGEEYAGSLEFAIDLCAESRPSQIVVARIKREPTLAGAIARVKREVKDMEALGITDPKRAAHLQNVGPNDVLLVPDLGWLVSHHYFELEGRTFVNAKLKGRRLDVAQQDISFRLNRSGAELKSESKMFVSPIPTRYVLDRPFLIYMSQRDAKTPYFAVWVDNGELLTNWPQ